MHHSKTGFSAKRCEQNIREVPATVARSPLLTVSVFSQDLNPDFSSFTLWSPAAKRRVEGVLPIYFLSTVISAPSGVDLMSMEDNDGSAPID